MFAMLITTGTCIEDGKFEEVGYKITSGESVCIEEWDRYSEASCETEDYQDWTVYLITSASPFSAIVTTVSNGEVDSEKREAERVERIEDFI